MTAAHYLLQVNIYLVIFYAFYKVLLAKETFFMLNRVYLMTAGFLSLLIPFFKPEWFTGTAAHQTIQLSADQLNAVMANVTLVTDQASFGWGQLVTLLYLCGLAFFLLRFLYQLHAVSRLIKDKPAGTAFSFMRRKIIDTNLPELDTVEAHENIHVKQLHSLDILFFELMGILTWCNPVIYLYKSTLRDIHEYLADEEAAKFQADKEAYSLLLLSAAFGIDKNVLTNSFYTQSLIKKRIFMLNKQRSTKTALVKYGLFLPLFAGMLLFSSATISGNEEIKSVSEKLTTVNPADFVSQSVVSNPVADSTAPSFPGGMEKFYQYLAKAVRYPEDAVKKGTQGKVFVSYMVEKDGRITDVGVEKSVSPSIDAEAVRVMKASPKWNPGLTNGSPVRVKLTLPIAFALSKNQDKKAATFQTDSVYIAANTKPIMIRLDGPAPNGPKPLYVVDGEKMTEDISKLNPNDIESMQVFKNESAIATYGEEGKNGVILITTKKGKLKNVTPSEPAKN